MTEIKKTGNPSATPIIYVHAKGTDRASDKQTRDLLELGFPLCSRLANDGMVRTIHGFDRPGLLLAELAGVYPDRPVIFLRAGLQPSKQILDQLLLLLEPTEVPLVLTLLSNAETTVNPFAGLQAPAKDIDCDLGELIKMLAPGQIHTLTSWTDHFALLSGSAVKHLAKGSTDSDSTLMQALTAAHGTLKVADHLFLHDLSKKVFEPLKLHPHESPQPPPFSELSTRLQDWYDAGITRLPYKKFPQRPATLHITHSWGGGVASWLQSFVTADSRRVHYQLRSEEARAGRDYGQKLSLYARNELRCPIASWWLQPPIPSVVDSDAGYMEILAEICRRYGIGRVFVSSLIGHSLDALRSGLPTVHILHDHFPMWPLLSVNPDPYILDDGGVDLVSALEEQRESLKFPDKDATAWLQIRRAYMDALIGNKVKIAVPGRWVLALQSRLDPSFRDLPCKVIPHGFPAMAGLHPVFPKARKDGRLRMAILGRMQAGKGRRLLSRALPGLTEHVQVYLLGTGKSGEAFFGCPGVDVVLEYDRDELPRLLTTIGPDFAALLSVVPETYSYTLSELQQLQIPVVATRVGSFPDRIEHGKTGWLVDTDADALIKQVAALCRRPGLIESVRRNLPGKKAHTPGQMASAYNNFCPLPKKIAPFKPAQSRQELTQWAAADYRRSLAENDLKRALNEQKQLTREVASRSAWAQKTSAELKAEQQRREQWVGQLNGEIDRLKKELDSRTAWAQKSDEQLKLERARGRKWLKQTRQLSKEVETRTEWAQKTDAELKAEQQHREQWVGQLNGEIDRLKKELDSRSEWAKKTDEQLKLERARGRKWLKQTRQLSKEVETRTEWAQKTSAELKAEQQRREQWVGQLNGEIDRLNKELENRTEWAKKTDEQLKLERARGRKWLKQTRQLSKEVETRTEWAQKTDAELKAEQQRREQWVGQLNGEIDRLKKELDSRTEWAKKTDEQLKLERARGRKWLKQTRQLSKEVETRTEWAQRTDAELKAEQQRREQWVGQLNGEIDRLNKELESRTEWALETNRELELEQQRREQWVGQLESEISRLQRTMTDQQTELENKNLELENIQVELGKFLEILEDRQARLDSKQKELDDTRTELGTKERELLGVQSELENRQVALETLQTDFGNTRTALEHSHARFAQLESDYQQVSDLKALILQSSSWKITRPLRALRRVGKNFMLARAWNPQRWPWLFSHLVKNLATLGFTGTLRRLQDTATGAMPEPGVIVEKEAIFVTDAPEVFKYYDHPDASIVIPVYNKWDYTSACLNSLVENRGEYTFEVIVVDDQSSDETPQELARIGGIKYISNQQNLGFVGSCNRGAKHARGEFLVMLNNDTQVTDGWLDELIDTFKQEPEAGLVGSRLVYPDGRLQESGGMIFKDGSGWNYGREQEAERPDYLFLRESDYCSGACIALQTGFFHQLGGFDERYAPAYYEDTDLAFRVREYGRKVFIQPMSVVIHHEGVTSGTDTSTGIKKYQLINQEKFLQRWWAQLQKQPDPISDPQNLRLVRNAIHHRCKGRILFIDATTPEPDQDSGSVRLTNLLKICRALGYDVTFFADNRAYRGRYTRDLQKAGIEVLYNPWLEALKEFFEERGNEYDYVFISRHYIAINYIKLLKRYCPDAYFIFDTVDLHYLREQRLAELEKSKTLKSAARQTRRSELSVIKAADATLVVSSVEQAVLAEDAPDSRVHVLSNIHHVPGRGKGFEERRDIYFVGGYQHPPNIDAACWFVSDIWPLIHQQLPDMRFHLIGSKAPEQVSSLHGDGVIFHGFVESLEPFLNGCRLAVAPLRYGAGVKGKVNMSMAHGQPMVATPVAGEGMFAEHSREFLLAEGAESFAAEVVRLYQDEALWYRLSDASIKNVEEHFSVKAAQNSLVSLLDSVTKT